MAKTQGIDVENPIVIENDIYLHEAAEKIAPILLNIIAVAYLQIGSELFDVDYSDPQVGVVVSPMRGSSYERADKVRAAVQHYVSPEKVTRPEEVDYDAL